MAEVDFMEYMTFKQDVWRENQELHRELDELKQTVTEYRYRLDYCEDVINSMNSFTILEWDKGEK